MIENVYNIIAHGNGAGTASYIAIGLGCLSIGISSALILPSFMEDLEEGIKKVKKWKEGRLEKQIK